MVFDLLQTKNGRKKRKKQSWKSHQSYCTTVRWSKGLIVFLSREIREMERDYLRLSQNFDLCHTVFSTSFWVSRCCLRQRCPIGVIKVWNKHLTHLSSALIKASSFHSFSIHYSEINHDKPMFQWTLVSLRVGVLSYFLSIIIDVFNVDLWLCCFN